VLAGFQSEHPLLNSTGERRGNDRYPIVRDVRYKVVSGRGDPDSGVGKTVDVSSRGVLFTSQKPLPPGKRVELSISWPAQLDGKCALKLVARGRITRCRGNHVAVEIDKYEFRTQGSRSLTAPDKL
jgi:hypothetical protein